MTFFSIYFLIGGIIASIAHEPGEKLAWLRFLIWTCTWPLTFLIGIYLSITGQIVGFKVWLESKDNKDEEPK